MTVIFHLFLYIPPVYPFTALWSLYVPPVQHSTNLRSAHTLYLSVLCGSQNQQPLFPYTTLTDRFLKPRFNLLKPSGHYMYRQINIQHFYVLPTQLYLCVLCGSHYKQPLFPYTALTDWFVLECVYCAVRTRYLSISKVTFSLSSVPQYLSWYSHSLRLDGPSIEYQ